MYKDKQLSTSNVDKRDVAYAVEDMKQVAKNRRRVFERRWYDNNFFDDGFHFRYLSRSSNKVVDLSERSTIYTPQRSIPKASRQIRGVANLLLSSDPTPTVYPDPVKSVEGLSDQIVKILKDRQKKIAQRRGQWLINEWKKDDLTGESVLEKVAHMVLLSLKHGIGYMEVWPDEQEELIRTQVYDAFDIYLLGNLNSIYHCPFMIKGIPMLMAQIKANELFDEAQRDQLTPDNRKASSEIKEAYLQARYGRDTTSDQAATIVLNEAFIKEYLNDYNMERIKGQEDAERILKKRKKGQPVIRHVFTAGNVWLYDKYTNLNEYPFIDFRMEPGPLYSVPMIERFMPANKSLDSVISRVERYTHTMVTGSWLKRRGEQFKINNIAGGQVIEYDATPPTQNQIAPIPPFVYEFIGLLTNFIEEQGVSTTTLGKLPEGVRANAAIESLKESEYANLVIASRRLKASMVRLARKFLEIADEYYITPHSVAYDDKGDTISYQVIGKTALDDRKRLKVETPEDLVPLAKDAVVDIEIEQGMAYTKEGQKATIQAVINTMLQYVQAGIVPAQAAQVVVNKYLETYQFGSTQEFMEEMDKALESGTPLSEQTIQQMKAAVLEALKDAGEIGPEGDQAKVMTTKIGVLEALKESGMAKGIMGTQQQPQKAPSESINYKDAPPDIQRQMEAQAGFRPSTTNQTTDQALEAAKLMVEAKKAQDAHEDSQLMARGGGLNGQQSSRKPGNGQQRSQKQAKTQRS